MVPEMDEFPRFRRPASSRETVPFVLLSAFCVYVLAWFWQASSRMELLDSINFELVLGSVLAFVSLLMIATKPPKLAGLCRALIGLALLLLLVISVRVPGSPDPVVAWDMYMERVVKFSFWAIFIAALVRSPRDLRWFIGAFLVACGYICFESVRGGLFGGMMWQNQGVMRLHGTTLLFRHPNSLAGLALGLVPFAYYLLPLAKTKFKWKII